MSAAPGRPKQARTAAREGEGSPISEWVICQTDDGLTRVQFRAIDDGSVWLNQQEIAELFATTKQNVSLHIKNVLAEGELSEEATVKESLTVQTEGNRQVQRKVPLYHLPLILAVGYRVRSARGTQFRQWATAHLTEYLVKGFVMDDGPHGLSWQRLPLRWRAPHPPVQPRKPSVPPLNSLSCGNTSASAASSAPNQRPRVAAYCSVAVVGIQLPWLPESSGPPTVWSGKVP